ncbi:peptidoglycan-binding protein [Streptomyces sp. NPDC048305]|uniref:peptidoglycan-binding domain-containing protein n=1 Tax=Streptomyces sp. NPDC048305 TaxID=3365532 RepID=UPI00371C473A
MARRSRTARRAVNGVAMASAVAIAATGFLGIQPAAASPAGTQAVAQQQLGAAAYPEVSRAEVLRRAATWLTANNGGPVPYSQTSVWRDGYRQDCSGYVSMTLGLWKSGPNTVELAGNRSLTTPITVGGLKPGDLLIDASGSNTTRHVVIFEKWTDSSHSSYWAYEQRGTYGTTHRTLSYGLSSGSEYKPYRAANIADGSTPTPPPSTGTWPVLKQGATGTDVRTVQYLLRGRGYSLAVDGSFGTDTHAKVRSFQSSSGLDVDGVVGPQTWSALIRTIHLGATGDAVRAAQTQLNAHGANLVVDGSFGTATDSATRSFQRAKGLEVDGSVGPITWQALVGS